MARWFVVIRARGPGWDSGRRLREQPLWDAHAAFIDDLEAKGVVRLAGPVEGSADALLIVRAEHAGEVEAAMAVDPWTGAGMLTTTRIAPWNVLVGKDRL
jgi:uncharacterized protein